MRPVYDRAQPRRPGMIAMDDAWWEWLFFEKETEKDDPTFFAVHDTDGEADAYATYRVKHEWTDSLPKLELTVSSWSRPPRTPTPTSGGTCSTSTWSIG